MLNLSQIAQTCVKCAKCVPSCTIYQINRDEATSPRGFVDLLGVYDKRGLPLDKNLKNIFESCFMCTTCTTLCPQSIDTASMIQQSRIDIAQKFGISWHKKIYFYLLRHRKLMDIVFSITAFIAPCFFKRNDDKLRSRFRLSALGKRTIFPFATKSFLRKHKDLQTPKATSNPHKIAIFIGCLSNYNYPQIGESLLAILDRLQITPIVPKQECCGAPAYFAGDIKSVEHLAKKNIALFESFIDEVEAILIPEATCAAMVMVDWKHALAYSEENSSWITRLEAILPKIYMASEYLYHHTKLLEILQQGEKLATKITYHDPCHAKKVLHIAKEPRAFIEANYNLIEMRECDRCCGFGGVTIQSEKYPLAYNAGIPKAYNIKDSGAEIVSAECSACRMQLNNALDNANINVAFKHPLELIEDSLKKINK